MAPSHPAQRAAATRGSLSARQWTDIDRAARIARTRGVVIALPCGVTVSAAEDKPATSGSQKQVEQQDGARRGASGQHSTATDEEAAARSKRKKEEREALRRETHVPRRCVNRWLALVQPTLWAARRQLLDAVFTAYMRAGLSPKRDAQRKLRDLFRRFDRRHRHAQVGDMSMDKPPAAGQPATGSRARLDDDLQSISTDEELDGIALHKAIEDPELQAAIAMSLEDSHRSASPSGRKVAFTRSLDEAGIPATPGSARGHRKKRSGK